MSRPTAYINFASAINTGIIGTCVHDYLINFLGKEKTRNATPKPGWIFWDYENLINLIGIFSERAKNVSVIDLIVNSNFRYDEFAGDFSLDQVFLIKVRISERYACRLVGISQNTKRYRPVDKSEDKQITERLVALSARWKRFGYRRLHVILQREGIKINHKRTYRLYKEAGLSLQKRSKKKRYEKRGNAGTGKYGIQHPLDNGFCQ